MTTATPPPSPQDITASYGFVAKLAQAIPELNNLLQQAIANQWSPQRFTQSVADSGWYQTHSDTARKWITTQATDPASAAQQSAEAATKVRYSATQLGIQLTDADIQNISTNFELTGGSDTATLERTIRSFKKPYDPSAVGGVLGTNDAAVRKAYEEYAWSGNPAQKEQDVQWWSSRITAGETTIQEVTDRLKAQAKAMYPSLQPQLDSGVTVAQAAQPFQQRMSQILELDPQSISLNDKNVQQALQARDDSGKPTTKPMWEFENDLRKDPRWQTTTNARDAAVSVVKTIGQNYGFLK